MQAKTHLDATLNSGRGLDAPPRARRLAARRANELDGVTWTRYSMSVWSDLKKSPDETALKHPAMFPVALVQRLVRCFTASDDRVVLDPFSGAGSTLIGAMQERKQGVGFEIVPSYAELTHRRITGRRLHSDATGLPVPVVYRADARTLSQVLRPDSVDFCLTSPPYWDILSRKRTADYKETCDYGEEQSDLAKVHGYGEFVDELGKVFDQVYWTLKAGKYCVVDVMDIRKKDRFYPFHSDLASRLKTCGFIFDDIVIWDRRQEYNNLRPLGYPSVFRINKVHEYLLIFRKPQRPGAVDLHC